MTKWRWVVALTAFAIFGSSAPAEAVQVTSLRLETITGAPVGDVIPVFLGTDIARFRAERNYANGVYIRAETLVPGTFFLLAFAPPEGGSLVPGRYTGAGPLPLGDPAKPRLSVSGSDCDDLTGSFEVFQIAYDADGQVLSFWATFQANCGAQHPGLLGEIRFAADVGLALHGPSRVSAIESRELVVNVAVGSESAGPILLTAESLPSGAVFEDRGDGTGSLRWTPEVSQFGAHTIAFMATDAAARTDRVLTRIQVTASNDSIDGATRVETLPFSTVIDSVHATADPTDPACGGGGWTLWYALKVPRGTEIEIRVESGIVGVFAGAPTALVQVACDRNAVRFTAAAGEEYSIVVVGTDTLLIDEVPPPPANDDFDRATLVSTLPFSDAIDTRGATGADDDPLCYGPCGTVWYRYTPDETRSIGASSWGSDYDARIFVFKGSRGTLELITELWGSYRLVVEAGTTYNFMVTSRTLDLFGGHLIFALTDRPPLAIGITIEHVADIDLRSRVATLRGELTCSSPARVIAGITLVRRLARRILYAPATTVLECTGRTPFEIFVQTYFSGFALTFPPGPISVNVGANGVGLSTGEWAEANISGLSVLLRGQP